MEKGIYSLAGFKATSQRLQDEAIANTQIIEELAGLEKYISETYISRVFYEIIQNADDCESERFHAFRHDQSILLFNDGQAFSDADLESLCRSAFSSKQRGVNIGYRGIGFKSVAGICKMVSVISGELEVCFSREKTHELLAKDSRVPLLRVPHMGSLDQELTAVAKAYAEEQGMKTCIILHNADSESLLNDLQGLNRTSISFLRNLLEIDINLGSYAKTLVAERISGSSKKIGEISQRDIVVTTKTRNNGKETSAQHDVRIWGYRNIGISTEIKENKPLRLKKNEAYAQAFLPMLTTTGLGARINGDFSTDPSRTRINPDEFTKRILDDLVELILNLLDRLCDNNMSSAEKELLEVLIPYKNASVFDISPSYISEQIKDRISDSDGILLSAFMLCPQWLKKTDYEMLAEAGRYKTLSFEQVAISDYESLFLSLGATKPGLPRVLELLAKTRLSSSGVISFWRHILYEDIRVTAGFKALDSSLVQSARIFLCTDGIARSGSEVCTNTEHQLDIIFMASLFDMAGRSTDAADLCIQCGIPICKIPASLLETIKESLLKSGKEIHAEMLKVVSSAQQRSEAGNDGNSQSLSRQNALKLKDKSKKVHGKRNEASWRDIERFAGFILEELGFEAEDVSKRNLGYDYTAYKDGRKYCIEVKKTEGLGDDFILTDNEIYVAKDTGQNYWVLIVVQPDPNQPPTYYSIIKDFYRTFEKHMIRRCIKYQMFCSEYSTDFMPLSFE